MADADQAEWLDTIWLTVAEALGTLGFVLNSREETEQFMSDLPRDHEIRRQP